VLRLVVNASNDVDLEIEIVYEDVDLASRTISARYTASWTAKIDPAAGLLADATALRDLQRSRIPGPDSPTS
jgi:hypothetical protein